MTFGAPQFLYGLVLIPAMALFLVWAAKRRHNAIARLGDPALIDQLSLSVNRRGRYMRNWLWLLALALTIVALTRPQWGSEVQTVERQGVQIMVALDVSKSMLAEDVKPNRLARAKLETADLMNQLNGDEVGLVLFSGASFVQFPLTFDYATARTFLETASPNAISRQGTAVAEAINTSLVGFNPQRASQKVIVIMTDGEDHVGDPLAAARRAVEEGAIIYTIGFGSPDGEPIPVRNSRGETVAFIEDEAGEVVLSRLDEVTLQQIAREAGGKYYRARADGAAIRALAEELDNLEKAYTESELETQQVERFPGFLLVSLLALVVLELIPDRVTTWLTFFRASRASVLDG